MPFIKKYLLTDISLALLLYATVLIYQGYQFGQSDQSQILPVLYAQDHPGAYQNDHYVQAYLAGGTNERTIYHVLSRHIGYDNSWLVFAWHAFFSIILFLAWISIAGLFIKNKALQWTSMALLFTIGFHTSTGSNELYYNLLIPSLPAKALASWSLYYWLKDKYKRWVVLLVVSTFLQPLVGMQLFLLTSMALFIDQLRKGTLATYPWKISIVYFLAVLPFIVLLVINNGGHNNPDTFMDIMEFRLSHHFFGLSFGIHHLALGILFGIIAMVFYRERLRWMFICIGVGCVVYEVGVELLRSPLILYSQWWKTTIWWEVFAFIALISIIESQFKLAEKNKMALISIPFFVILAVSVYRFSGISAAPDFMEPFLTSQSDAVDISLQAKQLTPENATFIIPPDLSAFRWYAKRSTYVDYKAMLHQEDFLDEWYERINRIYNYSLSDKRSGITIYQQSSMILDNLSPEKIEEWKSLGITHVITFSPGNSFLHLLGQNDSYALYRIP